MTLVIWTWILAALVLGVYETFAFCRGWKTLSASVRDATRAWPFLSSVIGLIVGGLFVHFWLCG